jgi:hypothetical protein
VVVKKVRGGEYVSWITVRQITERERLTSHRRWGYTVGSPRASPWSSA